MAGTFYGREKYDPQLIISQIIIMQCLHYLGLGFSYFLMDTLMGVPLTLSQFFSDDAFSNISTRMAWATIFGILINSIFNIAALIVVVERAKKCLDYGGTVYFLHICFCFMFNGIPGCWQWWLCNILALIIAVVFGEYVCANRELREIPMTRLASRA
mmetsp:Transcript_36912/g.77090  ORF Transcript_36912/g.77090 Transcript_36912/m.77090 type:complete len:157 (-) Transcript_36912:99-569(-)